MLCHSCDLGCCSRTVVVIKAAANPRLYWALVRMRQPSVIWRLHSWNAASEATSTRERRAERTARYLGAISHPGSCWKTSTLMIGIERSRARGAKQRIQSRGCSRQPLGRGSTWNKSKVNDTIGTWQHALKDSGTYSTVLLQWQCRQCGAFSYKAPVF